MRLFRPYVRLVLWLAVLAVVTSAVAQTPRPAGTLTLSLTSVAVGVGANWGSGVLTTGGNRYPFAINGLEVGGVGVSKVQARGQVYDLSRVADFAGTYVAAEGGATVGAGAGVLTMRNQHGVVINIQSTQQGVKVNAGGEGITIRLKNHATRS